MAQASISPVPDDPASSRPIAERPALGFKPAVYTRDATLPVLITRIEAAARLSPHVQIDLTGDISRYATSAQALDLVLAEQVVLIELNSTRRANSLPPVQLSYALPDDPSAGATPGLADLGTLGVQRHLTFLTPEQRTLLDRLARPSTAVGIGATEFSARDEDALDMTNEVGEVTLLPIVRLDDTLGSVAPLVQRTRQHLQAMLQQGLPGIDARFVAQIMTFVEESASNVREHAGKGLPTCTGFAAANRTFRRYRDRERDQWVEVYTTYVSCYDLGRGILASLTEVPRYAIELGGVQPGDRGLAALRLAARPGVSSQPGDGHGGGLPHMIQIVRDLDTTSDVAGDGSTRRYRGALQIVSDGAILENLTTTVRARHDRPLPGVQVHLWLQAIQRGARALRSEG